MNDCNFAKVQSPQNRVGASGDVEEIELMAYGFKVLLLGRFKGLGSKLGIAKSNSAVLSS